jgi:PPOX class probable FMN-dependent enzyme
METVDKENEITDQDSLEEHFGEPMHIALAVEKPRLDDFHKRFIAYSPFMCLASAGADGQPSVSPKGDAPGFVKVVDDVTLVLPDRPGNNKVETFHNLIENPKVSLVFFVPGRTESLRIHGEARLVRDEELLVEVQARNKLPRAALVINVTRAYFHCGKALIRSKLWDPSQHPDKDVLPPFGHMVREQANAPMSNDEVQEHIEAEYLNNLY